MSIDISTINKSFENRIRLGIMSLLCINESMDFLELKERLEITDGNLASHTKGLEELNYIQIKKSFIGKKTKTTYYPTRLGILAFKEHLQALEKMIKFLE